MAHSEGFSNLIPQTAADLSPMFGQDKISRHNIHEACATYSQSRSLAVSGDDSALLRVMEWERKARKAQASRLLVCFQ